MHFSRMLQRSSPEVPTRRAQAVSSSGAGVATAARSRTGGVKHATVRDKPWDSALGGRGLACGKPARAGTLHGCLPTSASRPRGCSSMVEPQPSKLVMRVRFPSSALIRPAHAVYSALFSPPLRYAIESRARCVPDGLAARLVSLCPCSRFRRRTCPSPQVGMPPQPPASASPACWAAAFAGARRAEDPVSGIVVTRAIVKTCGSWRRGSVGVVRGW
jgi:hypothetical protein